MNNFFFNIIIRFIGLAICPILFFCCNTNGGQTLAIEDITVLNMVDDIELPNRTIIIKENRIVEIGSAKEIKIPRNAIKVDGRGKYIIPGMWDMHVHIQWAFMENHLDLFFKYGITSVREMGSDPEFTKNLIAKIGAGKVKGPRIKFCGPPIESPEWMDYALNESGNPSKEDYSKSRLLISNKEEVDQKIDYLVRLGVDFIKMRNFPDSATYFAIAKAAKRAKLPLVGHAPYNLDQKEVALAGQRSFEHGWYPNLEDISPIELNSLLSIYKANGIAVVPTLSTWYPQSLPLREIEKVLQGDSLNHKLAELPQELIEKWKQKAKAKRDKNELGNWSPSVLENQAKEVVNLFNKGVMVLPGTDVGGLFVFPGYSLHQELEFFVKGGMTPMQALKSATIESAKFMEMDDSLGTIEKGKLADLIILDKNPSIDITNLHSIKMTIKNGAMVFEK